jgi:hypothetical protein
LGRETGNALFLYFLTIYGEFNAELATPTMMVALKADKSEFAPVCLVSSRLPEVYDFQWLTPR